MARAEQMNFIIFFLIAKLKWKYHKYLGYIGIILALFIFQVIVFFYIPWTSHWVPSFIIYPFAVVDSVAILWILQTMEKFMNHGVLPNPPANSENQDNEDINN